MLRKGDSAIVVMSVDTHPSQIQDNLPPFLKKKDKITFTFQDPGYFCEPGGDEGWTDKMESAKQKTERSAPVEKLS